MDPELTPADLDWLPEDSQLDLDEDSELDEARELANEIFEEDHDGDDYRARRIWL